MRTIRVCAIIVALAIVLLLSAGPAGAVRIDTAYVAAPEPAALVRTPSVETTPPRDDITQIDCMTLSVNARPDRGGTVGRTRAGIPEPVAFSLIALGVVGLVPRGKRS
jgi:hypothetical protein